MFPVLATPYEPALDIEKMAETGKCSRCDVDLVLLNVEINLFNRRQVYWYRCGKCEQVINTDVYIVSNLPC